MSVEKSRLVATMSIYRLNFDATTSPAHQIIRERTLHRFGAQLLGKVGKTSF